MTLRRVFVVLSVLVLAGCPSPGNHDVSGPGPADPAHSEVAVDRTTGVAADGADAVAITVTVRDAAGTALAGQQVTLAVTGTGNSLTQPGVTDANGQAHATLSSTVAETKVLSASIAQGAIPGQPSVTFVAGVASPSASTVSVSPDTVAADGLTAATVTVTVKDAQNNPVANQPVVLSATGTGNVFLQPAATDSHGIAVGTIKSTHAELKSITATVGAITVLQQPLVTFLAGAPAKLSFAVPPSNTTAGAVLAPAPQVVVQDAQGNTVSGATAAITAALLNGPSATLSGTRTVNAVGGVAAFNDLSIDRTGSGYQLQVSSPGLSSVTSGAFDVTPGTSSKLAFVVSPTAAIAGTPISPAVQVALEDASGNVVTTANQTVTLSLGNPAGGPIAGATAVQAVNGVATFSDLTLAHSVTGETLVATASGYSGATSGSFDVTPGAASKLVFVVQPSGAVSQQAISPAIKVAVTDAAGNVLTTDNRAVTLALSANPGSSALSGTTTVGAVNGVATFSGLSIAGAGTGYTLAATASGLTTAISTSFDVTAGAATRLVFATQPATVSAGSTLSPVRVTVEDAAGNPVLTASPAVSLALAGGSGGASLLGTTAVNASSGVATFSDLSVQKAGAGYHLTATATGLTAATSGNFDVTAGTAAQLAFLQQPANQTAGATLSPAPSVQVQDAYGNQVTSSSAQVTVALGGGTSGAVLSGAATFGTSSGVATFTGLSIQKVGAGYHLTASATGLSSTTSANFDITPGSAATLVFVQQPASQTAGTALNPAPSVQVQDAFGNPVTSASTAVTMALSGGSSGAALSGTTTVAASSGVATFTALSVQKVGTGYQLTASSTGLTSATSGTFDVTAGSAAQLVFLQQPANQTAGATLSPAPSVQVQDAFGNPVTSSVAVTIALGGGSAGATLSGTTVATTSGGVASFPALSVQKAGTGYQLTASANGTTSGSSGSFDITAGAASKLTFQQQPTTQTAGANLSPVPSVRVEDAYGNLVTSSNLPVYLALNGGQGGATLSGQTVVNAVSGVASFPGLSISKAGTGYFLVATTIGGVSQVSSSVFDITPAAAISFAFTQQPTSTPNDQRITPAVQVAYIDPYGNVATSSTGAVTVALGTNPSGGVLSGTRTVTPTAGVAQFTDLSIDKTGTGYTLVASGAPQPRTSASFDVVPAPIVVTAIDDFIGETSTVSAPVALAGLTLGAHLPLSDGGFAFYPGNVVDAGVFEIDGVPTQSYYLQYGRSFVATSARAVNVGNTQMGRPDVARADAGTILHLAISNLSPWQDDGTGLNSDDVQLFSVGAHQYIDGLHTFDSNGLYPNYGDVAFDEDADFGTIASFYTPWLPDSTKGDVTTITNLVTSDAGVPGVAYSAVGGVFTTSSLNVVDGQVTSLTVPFTPVPRNRTLTASWVLDAGTPGSFGAMTSQVHPSALSRYSYFYVDAIPTAQHGFYAGTPDLLTQVISLTANDHTATYAYGDPWSSWPQFAVAQHQYRVLRQIQFPDGGVSNSLYTSVTAAVDDVLPASGGTFPSTVKPLVSPVRSLQVDGANGYSDGSVRSTPVISWTVPSVGTPTFYTVAVRQLVVDAANGSLTFGPVVASFQTTLTQLQLPPGVLVSGGTYYLIVTADAMPGHQTQTAPYQLSFPEATAPAMSGILTVQ